MSCDSRLLAYGGNKIFRYLMWKHERRLAKTAMDVTKDGLAPVKKRSFLRRYVSILVGSGMLGFFIIKRVHPDYRKPGKEASNWEVGDTFSEEIPTTNTLT
ncbi:hypothetical protein RUM43_001200 [Polyplax serrata]|uniref:Uncharacterized protein n=1 Tax=Polyplax serrata TaxID=468196 RepID=A0AAN8SEH1_POLSC